MLCLLKSAIIGERFLWCINFAVGLEYSDSLQNFMDENTAAKPTSVSPTVLWIRIQWGPWIRIRIRIRDPDPDPGGIFEVLDGLF
jgi:hypothetical protein